MWKKIAVVGAITTFLSNPVVQAAGCGILVGLMLPGAVRAGKRLVAAGVEKAAEWKLEAEERFLEKAANRLAARRAQPQQEREAA